MVVLSVCFFLVVGTGLYSRIDEHRLQGVWTLNLLRDGWPRILAKALVGLHTISDGNCIKAKYYWLIIIMIQQLCCSEFFFCLSSRLPTSINGRQGCFPSNSCSWKLVWSAEPLHRAKRQVGKWSVLWTIVSTMPGATTRVVWLKGYAIPISEKDNP